VRNDAIVWVIVLALLGIGAPRRDAAAQPGTAAHLDVPPHITLTPVLTEIVGEMLKRSPRFREQWATLGAARHVRIAVRLDFRSGTYRARSIVSRHQYGLITATVELPAFGNHVELLAHEFEHIVEQLEGLNLRRLSTDLSAGVYNLGYAYETERAYEVGRQVARECLREPDGTGTEARRITQWAATRAAARARRRGDPAR
jgi:hypothetical protein